MKVPDISGYRLEDALELLKAGGIGNIAVQLTSSPRHRDTKYNGNSRVIRQRMLDEGNIELLVCNTDF